MKDNLAMQGSYVIQAVDKSSGEVIKTWNIKNQLTLINAQVRTQMLLGSYTGNADDLQIKYFAFGTGTMAVSENDTSLAYEVFRKQVTTISQTDNYTVQSIVSLGSNECNYHIKEIGVFGGSVATGTANSGTLLSRVLFDFDKNTNIVLNIVRNDIVTI